MAACCTAGAGWPAERCMDWESADRPPEGQAGGADAQQSGRLSAAAHHLSCQPLAACFLLIPARPICSTRLRCQAAAWCTPSPCCDAPLPLAEHLQQTPVWGDGVCRTTWPVCAGTRQPLRTPPPRTTMSSQRRRASASCMRRRHWPSAMWCGGSCQGSQVSTIRWAHEDTHLNKLDQAWSGLACGGVPCQRSQVT